MRLACILPVLIAAVFASSLAAQEGSTAYAGMSIHPLPEILAPRQALIDSEPVVMDPMEMGAVTGMLVGATLGVVYGAFFADECGVEDDCMLAREVRTVGFVAVGAGLGGIIGLGASYLLNRRAPASAPLGDGMRAGMTLRQ